MLRQLGRPERVAAMREAVAQTNGLYLPIQVIRGYEYRSGKNDDATGFLDPQDIANLRTCMLERLRRAARTDQLESQPHLLVLLRVWGDWGTSDEPRTWLAEHLPDDQVVLRLLRSAITRTHVHTAGEHIARGQDRMNLSDFEPLVSVEVLRERVQQLSGSAMDPADQDVVDVYERAIRRVDQGAANGPLDDDD